MSSPVIWHPVSTPIQPDEHIPAERKTVLVWLKESHLPFCGYIRYAAGDKGSPYFVVYHGNSEIGSDVIAWCDCLPDQGPDVPTAMTYSREQKTGRGFPERKSNMPVGDRESCDRCDGDGKAHGSDRPFEWLGPGTYPGLCPKCKGSGVSA